MPLVNSGEIDIAFCNAREFYDSYYGVGSSNKHPNPNIRAMAVLFPIQVALLVRNDSPIKSTKDLKGKTFAYGFASQEVIRILLDGLLANAGLTVKDVKTVLVPNLVRGVDELIAGDRVGLQGQQAEQQVAVRIDAGHDPSPWCS